MILKPADETKQGRGRPVGSGVKQEALPPSETLNSDAASDVLHTIGLRPDSKKVESDNIDSADLTEFKKHLKEHGGNLEAIAKSMVDVMKFGDSDNSKINASKTLASILGVLNEEASTDNVININIICNQQNKTLTDVVMPTR